MKAKEKKKPPHSTWGRRNEDNSNTGSLSSFAAGKNVGGFVTEPTNLRVIGGVPLGESRKGEG